MYITYIALKRFILHIYHQRFILDIWSNKVLLLRRFPVWLTSLFSLFQIMSICQISVRGSVLLSIAVLSIVGFCGLKVTWDQNTVIAEMKNRMDALQGEVEVPLISMQKFNIILSDLSFKIICCNFQLLVFILYLAPLILRDFCSWWKIFKNWEIFQPEKKDWNNWVVERFSEQRLQKVFSKRRGRNSRSRV